MSRPKTKGAPISIRLSEHHDHLLRLAAEQAGIPATQLATMLLERVLEPSPAHKPARAGRSHDPTCRCSMCKPDTDDTPVYRRKKTAAKR